MRFYQIKGLPLLAVVIFGHLSGAISSGQTPAYAVGNIPPLNAPQGSTLSIQLQATGIGSNSFSYSMDAGYPAPQGSLSLDNASGLFSYTPAVADKFQFRMTFAASGAGVLASQSVLITPITQLRPESDVIAVIQSSTAIPDEAANEYIVTTQSKNTVSELFNTVQQATSNFEISGKTIIFDQTDTVHTLFAAFNGQTNVKNLYIFAETLKIRSALTLPGTNVFVYARHLRFEDQQGQPPSSIDTTPIGWSFAPAQFQNGSNGQNGGDIQLIIDDLYSDPGTNVRIIANGGKAQDAGQGQSGSPWPDFVATPAPSNGNIAVGPWNMRWGAGVGREVLDWDFSKQSWGWVLDQSGNPLPQGNTPAVVYVFCQPCGQYRAGQAVWPQDGQNATPPGTPGIGGAGGAITSSSQSVSAFVQTIGGSSGAPGAAATGGPPQNPVYSAFLQTIDGSRCNDDYFNFQITATHTGVAGSDAAPIQAAQPQGGAGSFSALVESTQNPWLHPYWVRQVLAHAKDAYRGGNMDYTTSVLQDYSNLLGSYESSAGGGQASPDPSLPPDANLELQQVADEMTTILHRLANNMDYFGNAAGWVPLLSLQATMNAFQGEVEADVPLLYLSLYLQTLSNQNATNVAALQDGLSSLSKEATSTATDLDNLLQAAPGIETQAAQITADVQTFQQDLQQREDQLLSEAQQNIADQQKVPFWKKALRTISAIAEVVPVYQPALGAIGAGLNIITNVDTSKPLSTVENDLPQISSLFSGTTWTTSEKSFDTFVDSSPFSSFSNAESFAKLWSNAYQDNSKTLDQILPELKQTQAPADAVSQELARLEAQDSEFNDLTQRVRNLQAEKLAFTQKIAQAMQTISADNATINNDLLSEAALYQNLNSAAVAFDHGMMSYVKDMERRARERLLRYQYYMAKAFEYRFLQPYPGDLNIDNVVQQIQSVVGQQYPADISGIKSLYLQSVRDIVNTGLSQLANQPPERSVPLSFQLTSGQLQQLNQTGQINVDLGPLIAGLPNEDDRHLENLSVTAMTVNGNCSSSPFCRVRVEIEHNGQSTETSNGHKYNFDFGAGLNDQPFTWGASYDLLGGTLSQEGFSVPGLSLLQTFLTGDTTPSPGVTLFALPGADSVVTISRVQQPATINAQITGMQIQAIVDFYRNTSNQVQLSVQAPGAGAAYIELNQTDVTGRTDGIGSFQRAFTPGTTVTLNAEPLIGSLKFANWIDGQGLVLSTSSALTISLQSSESVQATYVPIDAGLTPSTTGLSFGNQVLGSQGSLSFTLSNTTGAALGPFSPILTGDNSAEFSLSSDCAASIPAGAACNVSIRFAPTTVGNRTASLAISYEALGSPTTISLSGYGIAVTALDPGLPGDIGLRGDFDSDGRPDLAVWRPASGTFYIAPSSNPSVAIEQQWGLPGDVPVIGDYDGDGKPDFAVWRPSEGNWYVLPSSSPTDYTIEQWGLPGDVPVPRDYDGDGKVDSAVWRPSEGNWYILPSSRPGDGIVQQWGLPGDVPVPGDYDGDGKPDFAVWRPSEGNWYILPSSRPGDEIVQQWGLPGDVPVAGDYDGDGLLDLAVWRPSDGTWYILPSNDPSLATQLQWGLPGDIPKP